MAEDEREFLSDSRPGFYLCLTGIFLTLAWVFGSWTRPIAVMMVTPFGLIGAASSAWHPTHHVFGRRPDWHGRHHHQRFHRAGHGDRRRNGERLRAVFLTTITTVGGLGPLLLEQSRQAAFLKPTVITLIYGLGFGIVVVLMITPTMIAIQHDVGLRLRSLRRLLRLAASRRKRRPAGR